MDRVKDMLDKNIPLRSGTWNIEEVAKINELIPMAITLKPIVYLVNLDSKSFKRKGNKWLVPINEWVNNHGGGIIIPMSVEWEQGLWNVKGDPAAKEAYLAETAGCKSALPRIVKVGYNALNLQVSLLSVSNSCTFHATSRPASHLHLRVSLCSTFSLRVTLRSGAGQSQQVHVLLRLLV
jgi:ribosome-binding ATPase YchF (GTP1/OBG family)